MRNPEKLYPGKQCDLRELKVYLRAKYGSDRARKAHSATWAKARKLARRKYNYWVPAYLMPDGSVYFWFPIRGNWSRTEGWQLDLLERVRR